MPQYFVKKALVKGEPKIIHKNIQKDGQVVKGPAQKLVDIVGFEIGAEGTDRTIVLDKDEAVAFVLQRGVNGAISNARVGVRPGRNGAEPTYYLQADGEKLKSLKDLAFRIDNEDGTLKAGYEKFAKPSRMTEKKTKVVKDNSAMLEKAKQDLAKKGLMKDFKF